MVKIGNNTDMCIKHIGSNYVLPHTNTTLVLNNHLHVPKIAKKFIIVSKFAQDNNFYFDIFLDTCYVKHQETNQVLLQGTIKDDLYVFPSFNLQLVSLRIMHRLSLRNLPYNFGMLDFVTVVIMLSRKF